MVRIVRGSVIAAVAIDAFVSDAVKTQAGFRYMAIRASRQRMRPHKREAVFLMQFRHLIDQPVLRGMASGAVRSKRPLMYIGMAGNTLRIGFRKDQRFMAAPAIHPGVLPAQGKPGFVVLKTRRILFEQPARCTGSLYRIDFGQFPGFKWYFPTGRRMAGGTVNLKGRAVRRLSGQTGCQPNEP